MSSITVIVKCACIVGVAAGQLQGLTARSTLQLPKARYPYLNPTPFSHSRANAQVPPVDVLRFPGNSRVIGQTQAAGDAYEPVMPVDDTPESWQGWADKALEWTKLAAAFRSTSDPALAEEMASAAEAEAAVTLTAVRQTVAKALEEKSRLTPVQASAESAKHEAGNYATKTAALGRAYSAETIWFSVFRAWAAAAKDKAAIAAAAMATASATEKTQKLAAFAPEATAKTSSKWRAAASEWEAAASEMKPAMALSEMTSSNFTSITALAVMGLSIGSVVFFGMLRSRYSTVNKRVEPLLPNALV